MQVSAGLSDQLTRLRKRSSGDRRGLVVIAIAAGFGAVFGTPIAGAVFALEVPTIGRIRGGRLLLICLVSALVGDRVARALGITHDSNPAFPTFAMTGRHALQVAAIALACTVLAVELFGGTILPFAAMACAIATMVSTRRSIYSAQHQVGHDKPAKRRIHPHKL